MPMHRPTEILGFEPDPDGWPVFRLACAAYNRQYIFRCPFCDRIHYHGPSGGHRAQHCPSPYSKLNKVGYYLELVDDWRRCGSLGKKIEDSLADRDLKNNVYRPW